MTTTTDLSSRWRGQPGRLEVWYTTLTDPATGTGVWIHHELVAPASGSVSTAPYGHGWVTVFEPGAPPLLRRFGPSPWPSPENAFAIPGVRYDGALTGRADDVSWALTSTSDGGTLHTFPRWAWRRELLPAAQVVPRPAARFTGTVRIGDRTLVLDGAPGADARIYGHGNAKRWGWLHADLGDGAVCEMVTAVSMRRGLDRLSPLALVRFRLPEGDWPRDALLAAVGLRTRLRDDGFEVRGRVGRRRVGITVDLPADGTVEVDYRDPDDAALVCRNSLLTSATIELTGGSSGDRTWTLDGTAHAEVGGFRA